MGALSPEAKNAYVSNLDFFSKKAQPSSLLRDANTLLESLSLTLASGAMLKFLTGGMDKQAVRKGCRAALQDVKGQANLLHPALLARANLAIALKLE